MQRDCKRRMECYPRMAVCEKRQGDGCHEGPFARRLRKGESWQQAAMCKGAAEHRETAEDCVRPGKYLRSDDSLSLSPVGIE